MLSGLQGSPLYCPFRSPQIRLQGLHSPVLQEHCRERPGDFPSEDALWRLSRQDFLRTLNTTLGLVLRMLSALWDSPGKNTGGLPFPPPGDLPFSGTEPEAPAQTGGFFAAEPPGSLYFPSPFTPPLPLWSALRHLRSLCPGSYKKGALTPEDAGHPGEAATVWPDCWARPCCPSP